jgi:hypothetical protein
MPQKSTIRTRKHRENKRKTEDAKLAGLSQPAARRSLKQALELLHESGLPVPSFEEIAKETPSDASLAIQRILAAAAQAQSIAAKRGELIPEERFREIVGGILMLVRSNIRCTFPALAATEAEASGHDPAVFRKTAERIAARVVVSIGRELQKIQATLPDD